MSGLTKENEKRVEALESTIVHLRKAASAWKDIAESDQPELLQRLQDCFDFTDPIPGIIVALELLSDAIEPKCFCRTEPGELDEEGGLCPRHDGTPEEHAAGQAELRAWVKSTERK